MIYTVTMNPAIDYVVHLENFMPGQVNRTKRELVQFGGKGINVATVLGSLGTPSVALGFLAGFTGKAIEDGLRTAGVKSDFIHLKEGLTRINIKIKAETESEINAQGPEIAEEDMQAFFEKVDTLQTGDYIVLAGSIPACLPKDTYQKILRRLAGRGVESVVDAEGELLLKVLPYRPFLIKPNHIELGGFFGKKLKGQEEILYYAGKLQEEGARNVLVSMAGDGAILLDETGKSHRVRAPKGQVKNSVGAGDSMVAGFLAGWHERRDPAYALALGAAAGSATAFADGLAGKKEIEQIFSQIEKGE